MDTFNKVKTITASTLGVEAESITTESNIIDDLGADSLAVVELIMALEDEFGISIPEEAAKNIKTVGDIVALISAK